MRGENFYLVSALPRMGELGSVPPLTLAEMLERLSDTEIPRQLVATVLLADDLLKRQAVLAGEIDRAEGVVLSDEQLRDQAPLPDYLAPSRQEDPARAVEAVWAAYFRHAAAVARATGSEFLSAWVGYEVGLRNALASARAKALSLEGAGYVVVADLAADEDYSAVVSGWSAAADPLEGSKALDRARWEWLDLHGGWFTFADDELAAYAAKLVLLHRWNRLAGRRQGQQ